MKFPLQMKSKSVRETRILVQNIWLCMYLASTSCQFLRVSLVKSNTCNSVCACLTLKWVLEREWLTDWMWELERVENTQNHFYICIHWLRGKCEILLIEICSSELDQRISIVVRMGFYFHFQRMTGPYHDEFKITFWNVRKTLKDTI